MQQAILHKLFDAITDLVCHHSLHTTEKGDAINALARAHLFTALRQLDGQHKGLAIQFLYEAGLIGAHVVADLPSAPPVLALNGADLRGLALPNANLAWAHLAVYSFQSLIDAEALQHRGQPVQTVTLGDAIEVEVHMREAS